MRFGFKHLFLIASWWASSIHAADLREVYLIAIDNDPTIQAAFAALKANEQAIPQAIAQMVPNITANYTTAGTDDNVAVFGDYNTHAYGITLTQPLFHPEHWAQFEQARHVTKGARAAYLSATQGLIIRVASQYFAILGAIDDLHFTQSQRKAFARELEQSKQRFEVGLIAITAVEEAKARHDNAVANEIAAQNAVFDQYEKLREITGRPLPEGVALFPITHPLSLVPPSPADQESWVASAHRYNLDVTVAKEKAEQQKALIAYQVSGHFPKFDFQADVQSYKGQPPYPFDLLTIQKTITLNVVFPLFAGGGTVFRTQEASARYEEAMKQLEAQQRTADSNTRQAYRGVLTAISGVEALAQAVVSNRSALDATQAAYEVGTRTMVDVLNAQSNLLSAQREHSKARYKYLLEGLKLKQASGILNMDDLCAVNALMVSKANS
jgi:outer membrane protein